MIRIGLVLPDVLGTYGDDGNALVLRSRARMRGRDAEIVRITLGEPIPDDCHVYTIGGGEDAAQMLAVQHLRQDGTLKALATEKPILAICAGLQILGHSFLAGGKVVEGLGLIDATTSPQENRSIGELITDPSDALTGLTEPLTGFENHLGATVLGPAAQPLATVRHGKGNNSSDKTEGAVQNQIVATYMHGPVLARNPQLADLLLARGLGIEPSELEPLDLPEVAALRRERLRA